VAYLFEYSLLPPSSCDGEPAPRRELALIAPIPPSPPDRPNGDRAGLPEGSIGEVLWLDAPERG
jgi:hypothetical protein